MRRYHTVATRRLNALKSPINSITLLRYLDLRTIGCILAALPMGIQYLREGLRASETARGVSILARSLFREMRAQGFSTEQIIGLSSELIQLVSQDLRQEPEPAE